MGTAGSCSKSRTSTTQRSKMAVPTWVSRVGALGYSRRTASRPSSRPVVTGDEVNQVAVECIHSTEQAIAEPDGAFRDRVEHGLDVGRRARDHPQDLACRRLLLQGLDEVAVPGLQLREQAHVLDRDHRLVGEGLHQLDLLVGEGMGLGSRVTMTPIGALSQHRDREDRPDLRAPLTRPCIVRVRQDVGYVDDAALEDGPAVAVSRPGRIGTPLEAPRCLGRATVVASDHDERARPSNR